MPTSIKEKLSNQGHKVEIRNGQLYDSTGKQVYQDNGRYYIKKGETRLYFGDNGSFYTLSPKSKKSSNAQQDSGNWFTRSLSKLANLSGEANPQGANAFIPYGSQKIVQLSQAANGVPVRTEDGSYRRYNETEQREAKRQLRALGTTAVLSPMGVSAPSGITKLKDIPETIVTLGKDLYRNPAKYVVKLPKGFINFSGSMAGGEAVDETSKYFTGNSFGENMSYITGLPAFIGDSLNPGYAVGGYGMNKMVSELWDSYATNRINPLIYNYITPMGYFNTINGGSRASEIKSVVKGLLKNEKVNTDDYPVWYKNLRSAWEQDGGLNAVIPNIVPTLSRGAQLEFRDASFRKYLGLKPRKGMELYVPNENGTFSYNMDVVNNVRRQYPTVDDMQKSYVSTMNTGDIKDLENQVNLLTGFGMSAANATPTAQRILAEKAFRLGNLPITDLVETPLYYWSNTSPKPGMWVTGGDVITGTGGGVGLQFLEGNKVRMYDPWDVQPFIDEKRLGNSAFSKIMHSLYPDFELSSVAGNKANPFTLDMVFEPKGRRVQFPVK